MTTTSLINKLEAAKALLDSRPDLIGTYSIKAAKEAFEYALAIIRQHEADTLIDSCENVQELADKVSQSGYSVMGGVGSDAGQGLQNSDAGLSTGTPPANTSEIPLAKPLDFNLPCNDCGATIHRPHHSLYCEKGPVMFASVKQNEPDEAYGYASRLFKILAPQCEPLNTTLGILTQLDNYIAGLRSSKTISLSELRSRIKYCQYLSKDEVMRVLDAAGVQYVE